MMKGATKAWHGQSTNKKLKNGFCATFKHRILNGVRGTVRFFFPGTHHECKHVMSGFLYYMIMNAARSPHLDRGSSRAESILHFAHLIDELPSCRTYSTKSDVQGQPDRHDVELANSVDAPVSRLTMTMRATSSCPSCRPKPRVRR